MEPVLHDLRLALRALRRAPGFALAAILSLGLGIGANTAIYTVYRSALLEPLPVAAPEQLVQLQTQRAENINHNLSYPHFKALRESGVFAQVMAETTGPLAIRFGNTTEQLQGAAVTPNFFSVLGVRARSGRTFNARQEVGGDATQVTVLSDALRNRWFGERFDVLGEVLHVNGHAFTVIGIMPASFTGMIRGVRDEFWIPLATYPLVTGSDYLARPQTSWLNVVARMHPDATLASTQARLATVDARLRQSQLLGPTHRNLIAPVGHGFDWPVAELRLPLRYLMAAVGLVLLIACANVANLLLARTAVRRRDLAVRLAIGGTRSRLLRQLMTESLCLALLAGAAGLLLASWLTDALAAYRSAEGTTLVLDTRPDARILGFTLGISLLSGLLFGLGPALRAAPPDLMAQLRDSGRVSARLGARGALVIVQVALSLALLGGATLLVRSVGRLNRVELGFQTRSALLASFDLDAGGYNSERGGLLVQQLLQRVRALPGVLAASAATTITPSPGGSRYDGVPIEGGAAPAHEASFDLNVVADQYFATLGVQIVQGRAFNARDRTGTTPVAIINEEMAHRYWPGQDPIGRRLVLDPERNITWQIIGVVRDGKYRGLREEPETNVWRPFNQSYRHYMTLIVRTRGEPRALTEALRNQLRALDPAIPMFDVRTLSQHIALATAQELMAMRLTTALALLALLLSAIGLYGLLAFMVAQQTREIGVRMALGAQRIIVLRDVMGRGLRLVGIGVLLGLPAALWASRLLGSMLYGISNTDPTSMLLAAVVLLAAGTLATLLPARRAIRVDPMIALRSE